jgi:hypothetical protein
MAATFPMDMADPPSVEFVPEPQPDEAIVFKDFFTAGLRMPPIWFLWTSYVNSECNCIN